MNFLSICFLNIQIFFIQSKTDTQSVFFNKKKTIKLSSWIKKCPEFFFKNLD